MKRWKDRTIEEKVELLHRNDILDTISYLMIGVTVLILIWLLSKIGGF